MISIKQEIKYIKIEDLKLWSENPRDPINFHLDDFEIIERAINDNQKWDLQKLVDKMGSFYDFSELPTVVLEKGKYIVYDGNRRISILKYIQNEKEFNEKGIFLKHGKYLNFLELKEIPCNLCDKATALDSIERKHIDDGSWKPLEREYFLHIHRGKEKSDFLWFEEQTGLISSNKIFNQRFVKDEVLNRNNLKQIGFDFQKSRGFLSNYNSEQTEKIFDEISKAISNKKISTRHSRGKLYEPLIESSPTLKEFIAPYDKNKTVYKLSKLEPNNDNELPKKNIKTPITNQKEPLFGGVLELKKGKVNDMYRAICSIHETQKKNKEVLPIVAMSLRLLLEVAARVYYENDKEISKTDQLYRRFLKVATEQMSMEQENINYYAVTEGWLQKSNTVEALLGKYAHGNLTVTEGDVIDSSKLVADVIKFYFSKKSGKKLA